MGLQEKRRKQHQGAGANGDAADGADGAPVETAAELAATAQQQQQAEADAAALKALAALPRAEIVRRLRALRQPVTLFGEDDGGRVVRLARAQKEAALVDDEARYGGQQENTLLAIQREARLRKKGGGGGGEGEAEREREAKADKGGKGAGGGKGEAAGGGGGGGKAEAAAGEGGGGEGPSKPADGGAGGDEGGAGGPGGAAGGLEDAFAAAAARLAEQRAEEAMVLEDRIAKYLRGWCQAWGDDLEARSDEAKASGAGHQATMVYKQSMRFMEPLWRSLETRNLDPELKASMI
jgi:pre-mRNA-splicing factor 18